MYGNPSFVHRTTWTLRRILRLSPTYTLFRELRKRGVDTRKMDAIELFGADGARHTLDYRDQVRSLEIWELDDKYRVGLEANFPRSTIRITDSYQELHRTISRFDLVVADTPGLIYGGDKIYYEHFNLFLEGLLKLAKDSTVVILNAIPDPSIHLPAPEKSAHYSSYLETRSTFYRTSAAVPIAIDQMIPAYEQIVRKQGFHLDWHASVRRTSRTGMYYLALKLDRL